MLLCQKIRNMDLLKTKNGNEKEILEVLKQDKEKKYVWIRYNKDIDGIIIQEITTIIERVLFLCTTNLRILKILRKIYPVEVEKYYSQIRKVLNSLPSQHFYFLGAENKNIAGCTYSSLNNRVFLSYERTVCVKKYGDEDLQLIITVLHELSHNVLKTEDYFYGKTSIHTDNKKKIKNADFFSYATVLIYLIDKRNDIYLIVDDEEYYYLFINNYELLEVLQSYN